VTPHTPYDAEGKRGWMADVDEHFAWETHSVGGKVTFVLGVAAEPDPERYRLTPDEAEEIGGDLMLAAKEARA
jgi:hypothetical protein